MKERRHQEMGLYSVGYQSSVSVRRWCLIKTWRKWRSEPYWCPGYQGEETSEVLEAGADATCEEQQRAVPDLETENKAKMLYQRGEPGGRLSMGSHRVGHNWSDLAVAAAAIGCPVIRGLGFPCGTVVKNLPANAGNPRDMGSIPGSRRSLTPIF